MPFTRQEVDNMYRNVAMHLREREEARMAEHPFVERAEKDKALMLSDVACFTAQAATARSPEEADFEIKRAEMLRLAAVDSPAGHDSFIKAAEIAENLFTADNYHSEAHVIRALTRHAIECHRRAGLSERLQAQLAERSRELGEAVVRAEKAEKQAADISRLYTVQQDVLRGVQRDLAEARRSIAAVTDTGR